MNLVAEGKRSPGPTRHTVNVRLLSVTFVLLAVSIPAIYFWHGYSLTRISLAFLEQANSLIEEAKQLESDPDKAREAENVLNKAVDMIWQFRRARPMDQASAVLMARTFDRSAKGRAGLAGRRRAAQLYVEAIALSTGPERTELKTSVGDIMLEIGDFAEAAKIGQQLVQVGNTGNAEATEAMATGTRIYATALFGQLRQGVGRTGSADLGAAFDIAIEKNPANTELPVLLAEIYRNKDYHEFLSESQRQQVAVANMSHFQKADEIVDRMVERNDKLASAYLQRFYYRMQVARQTEAANISDIENLRIAAELDLNRAWEIDPNDPVINMQMGRFLQRQCRETFSFASEQQSLLSNEQRTILEKAREHLENCIQVKPDMSLAWLSLGEVQSLLGAPEDALRSWSRAMELPEFETAIQPIQSSLRHHKISQLIQLDRLDEAQIELNAMKDYNANFSKRAGNPEQVADLIYLQQFLEGYLKYKSRAYGEAISILEKLLPDQPEQMGPWTLEVFRLLGGMYLELDRPELAVKTYKIAIENDRRSVEFKYLLGRALIRAARFVEAAEALESVVKVSSSADVWLEYAATLLERERRKTPEFRNLDLIRNALARARELNIEKPVERPWRLDIVQLQIILAGGPDSSKDPGLVPDYIAEFKTLATQLESDFGTDTDLLKVLSALCQQAGQQKDSMRLIQKFESLAGDNPDRFIFVASLQTGNQEFDAAGITLENGLSRVKEEEKLPLQLAQVSLLLRKGEFDAALEQLEKIAEQNDFATKLVSNIADLSIMFPNLIKAQPAKWESSLPKLEGDNGPLASMLAVFRMLPEYDNTEDLKRRQELLKSASALCGSIKFLRPGWAPVHSLHGLVLELQQNAWIQQAQLNQTTPQLPNEIRRSAEKLFPAKQSYQLAIELGERRPSILVRLADLETDPEIRRSLLAEFDQELVAIDPDLSNMQMAALIAGNDLKNAAKMAEFATQARPSDPLAWIARARIELMNGDIDKSVLSISQAKLFVDQSDNRLQTMLNLFRFYSTAHFFSASDDVVQSWGIEARSMIPGILELADSPMKLLLHAELLEELGDDAASDLYLQAVDKSPEDKMVLERALRYFGSENRSQTRALDQAIDFANKLVSMDSANSQYVQILARLLFKRGTGDDWVRINELLGGKDFETANSIENQRMMAILLLTRANVPNSERLGNLQRAYEMIRVHQSTTDLILTGQILRAWSLLLSGSEQASLRDEKLDEAENCFSKASVAADVTAAQLVAITEFFLERGKTEPEKWEVADSLIQKLQNMPSSSILNNAPIISLTARLRLAQGKESPESVIQFVEEYGASVEQESRSQARNVQARLLQQIANILDGIEAKEQALVWREKAAAMDTNLLLNLALERAKNGNLDEALQQCIKGYEETGLPDFVILISQFLLTENGSPEHFQQAENVFESALEKHSENLALITNIGNARIAGQNRIEDAIGLYERALKIDPNNQMVLNNLATAYTELPERLPDALLTINRALARYGNVPGLLDTKAVILMQQNDLVQAEKILTDIVNQISDSRFYWHLAEVHWKLYEQSGNPADLSQAQSAFDQSIRMGLEKQILTPGEKQRLSTLKDNLASRKIGARPEAVNLLMSLFAPRTEHAVTSCSRSEQQPCCNHAAIAPQIVPDNSIVIHI